MAAHRDSDRPIHGRRRAALLWPAVTVTLVGPFALAFFSGGFFDQPRIVAALVAWVLVAIAALASPRPIPRNRPARVALAGLALLTVWTGLSLTWAPVIDAGLDDLQRLALYTAALVAATAFLRGRALRALEPVTVLGAVVLLLYGMADRLLPHTVFLKHYFSAGSRLEQPLTYWNAMGLVAAIGLALAMRIAGDSTRPGALRALAAGAAAPLGVGLYLTFSRGAFAALAVGLVVLLAVAPTWSQLRSIVIGLEVGAVPAIVASQMPGIVNFNSTESARDVEGFVLIAVLVVCWLGGALLQTVAIRRECAGRLRGGRLPLPRRAGLIAASLVALAAAAFVAAAAHERGASRLPTGASNQRLGSLQSNRYEYWRVALRTFADHPLAGTGSGGFRVEWLRHRTISEQAKDAHSLYLETGAELGLVGLTCLGLFAGGLALAGRRALRSAPEAAAGPVAAVVMFAFHAGIDWDWEMPTVSLLALLFAGALLVLADGYPGVPTGLSWRTRARARAATAGSTARADRASATQ